MIQLVRLLTSQTAFPRIRILGASVLAGVSGVLVVAIVTAAARELAESPEVRVDWGLALLFGATIAVYAACERFVVAQVCAHLETAIHRLRKSLLERLAHADFERIESTGHADVHEGITQATLAISQNSQYLALALRSVVMVVAVLLYIAWVSLTAFILVLGATAVGALVYHRAGQRLGRGFAAMMDADKRLFESLSDLLDGFQEVRLSSRRRHDLSSAFAEVSATATEIRAEVQASAVRQFILGQVAVFFLLAVVVFVIPLYSPGFRGQVVQVTTCVLFMTGAIGAVIQTIPLLGASEQAATRMLHLEAQLTEIAEPPPPSAPPPADFTTLDLHGVTYAYAPPPGENGFTLGPIDLSLKRGEVVFVTGGNGSGKSTLIKLLTGLYLPQGGAIRVGGTAIDAGNRHLLRGLVSPVFSDFHLFPRLYGAPDIDPAEAEALLAWMEMDTVTQLSGDAFAHTALSAGQRKRLALVAALLENHPLLILDEWAADQDPHFRRKFYREILPALKQRGKTIVAVTHDDTYFDAADRRFHLEDGRLRPGKES